MKKSLTRQEAVSAHGRSTSHRSRSKASRSRQELVRKAASLGLGIFALFYFVYILYDLINGLRI